MAVSGTVMYASRHFEADESVYAYAPHHWPPTFALLLQWADNVAFCWVS
jgi:hypothetical protein